jgi:hypothetical protein
LNLFAFFREVTLGADRERQRYPTRLKESAVQLPAHHLAAVAGTLRKRLSGPVAQAALLPSPARAVPVASPEGEELLAVNAQLI